MGLPASGAGTSSHPHWSVLLGDGAASSHQCLCKQPTTGAPECDPSELRFPGIDLGGIVSSVPCVSCLPRKVT